MSVSRQTIRNMRRFAAQQGGECVSDRFEGMSSPLRWRCAKGHEWTAPASRVVTMGRWCGRCAPRTRLGMADMHALAEARGGDCLSARYEGIRSKLRWRCADGHEFEATPKSLRAGAWCHFCRPVGSLDEVKAFQLERYRKLASDRLGECLATRYEPSGVLVSWRCQRGHEWSAAPDAVLRGAWCPRCARTGPLDLDTFRQIAERRGGVCLSKRYVNLAARLRFRCARGHAWSTRAGIVRRGSWCPVCAQRDRGSHAVTLADLCDLADARGGQCLSLAYVAQSEPLRWRCREGHEWEQPARSIRTGSWCPTCTGRVQLMLDHMKKAARARGGKCLSKSFRSGREKLTWRCAQGHEWEASGVSVRGGNWCPACSERIPDAGIARMHTLAAARGGACLSGRHIEASRPLRWRCADGHEWRAREDVVVSGRWCPKCSTATPSLG